MPDSILVARAVGGDVNAYAALVHRHYPSCLRFAQRMLGNRADAEDAVQETFLRAHRAITTYEEQELFRSWLFRILSNRCRTIALQRARHERRFVSDERIVARAPADERAGDDGNLALVVAAIDALDPLLREAFLLKYMEDMEYAEMADVTGVGVSALKMRVKRACDALRPRLAEVLRDR